MQRNDRSYKNLKQKQKSAIADKTYKMYLKFYLENQRMPDAAEMNDICKSLFATVQTLAPQTEYEDFYKIVEKRERGYEERILRDIESGITLEILTAKKSIRSARRKSCYYKTEEATETGKTEERSKRKVDSR